MSTLTRIAFASAVAASIGTAASAARQPAFAQERECFNGTPVVCEWRSVWYCELRMQAIAIPPFVLPYLSCGFRETPAKWYAALLGNEDNDRYLPPKTPTLPSGGDEAP